MFEELTSLTNLLILASLIVNVITLLVVLSYQSNVKKKEKHVPAPKATKMYPQQSAIEVGVVFCRNCGNQYESTEKVCPSCRTPR
ncbi:zinc ribbon domain-containing protein [Paucisalibacillus sp. EB02]|uniref:zinc ribbon domain-containing protein n=1 Tax=Paucisalibacillus sp. EB02 TaxID=1347087 RepID=UPI0004B092A2|nr:zinc ribbon domain-containing protein [Paucisalibacillus sp. EB02]